MGQPATASLRWSRAALLGGVALTAGLLGHLSAGGLLPGPQAMLVILGCCIAGSAAFLGRPASRLRVVTLLVGGQTFVHGALTALAGHRGDPPLTHPAAATAPAPQPVTFSSGSEGRRVGSLMDQAYAGHRPPPTQMAVPYPVQHLLADMTGPHALMALAHLAAAVVVGLWLARGERALWTLLGHTAELAGRLLTPVLSLWVAAMTDAHRLATWAKALRRRASDVDLTITSSGEVSARSRPRRGPPALALA